MSAYEHYDYWYQDNIESLIGEFLDTDTGKEAYEIWVDMPKNEKWKAVTDYNVELLEAFGEWLESSPAICEFYYKFMDYCEQEFHDMLNSRAEQLADQEYQRQKEEGPIGEAI